MHGVSGDTAGSPETTGTTLTVARPEALGASPAGRPLSAWARTLARLGYREPARTPLRERLVPPMPDGPGHTPGPQSPALGRLGLRLPDALWDFSARWAGWIGPLVITLFSGLTIFWKLGTPNAIIFDETYYAKDSWALWHYGYEVNWPDHANDQILATPQTIPTPSGAAFIAHPPAGKWVIGLGEQLFGLNPVGWRFMVAVLGTLAVLMVCRIGRRLFRSTLAGCLAGLLMAVDGMHLVMSRTGLLDQMVMFWSLCGFGLLLIDRDRARSRLADAVGATADHPDARPDHALATRAWLGLRPFRLLAGICLGLAAATKWNGAPVVVAFALMSVLWDISARRAAGSRTPIRSALLRDGLLGAVAVVGGAFASYLASWSGWMATSGGYDRQWAAHRAGLSLDHVLGIPLPQVDMTWVPDVLRSLWHYHAEMWQFNTTLHSPHTYMSNPWGWLLNSRPVSYYYESPMRGHSGCQVAQCSSEVLGIGTPLLWWTACFALLYALYRWILRRDWRAGAILCGVAALYLPWFQHQDRTIFLFYTVAFEPYLVLAVAMMLTAMIGKHRPGSDRRLLGTIGAALILLAIMGNFLYFLPLWDAQVIPYNEWRSRMWWPTWI
jgi:dolichyl-phosphate-mannose--protein O-mannosyl transferase